MSARNSLNLRRKLYVHFATKKVHRMWQLWHASLCYWL